MKKIMLLGCALFSAVSVFATPSSDAVNKLYGNLTDEQVLVKLKNNEILPLFINQTVSFENENTKNIALRSAKNAISKHQNYVAYYNAAVIASTEKHEIALDEETELTETDFANAINWSTKAIELSKNRPAPDMYLLRAIVRGEQSGFFTPPFGVSKEYISEHKNVFRPIAADFEKVFEINPAVGAAYASYLAEIYEGLGNQEKAEKYYRISAQEAASNKAKSAIINSIHAVFPANKNTRKSNTSSNSSRSFFHHPREVNGVIWPTK